MEETGGSLGLGSWPTRELKRTLRAASSLIEPGEEYARARLTWEAGGLTVQGGAMEFSGRSAAGRFLLVAGRDRPQERFSRCIDHDTMRVLGRWPAERMRIDPTPCGIRVRNPDGQEPDRTFREPTDPPPGCLSVLLDADEAPSAAGFNVKRTAALRALRELAGIAEDGRCTLTLAPRQGLRAARATPGTPRPGNEICVTPLASRCDIPERCTAEFRHVLRALTAIHDPALDIVFRLDARAIVIRGTGGDETIVIRVLEARRETTGP